jgi:hypothetical protein
LNKKTASRLAVFVKAVLFVSAPPDRLRRGIKMAKKEHCGTDHALQSTKSGRITPSAERTAGPITATRLSASMRIPSSKTAPAFRPNRQCGASDPVQCLIYSLAEIHSQRGKDIMQTEYGKGAAFLIASLMLSACGGGGGGTVAAPTGVVVQTTPFTKWSDVQGTTNIEAKGLGKYANYTHVNGVVTSFDDIVQDSPNPQTSAVFSFDNGALTSVSINSNGRLAGGLTSNLTADPDFVTALDLTTRAVVSNPKSTAWNYQSFGVWENGLTSTNRTVGVMSVGSPTANFNRTGSATFYGEVVGSYVDTAGNGNTVLANLTVTANFDAKTLGLTTSGTRISPDVWQNQAFVSKGTLDLTGTLNIAGNGTFSGTLTTTSGLTGGSTGQFYGPGAVELGGVFVLPAAGTSVETYSGAYGATQTTP